MSLALYEWRKLSRLGALWVFVALCLALNGIFIAEEATGENRGYIASASDAVSELGARVDADFVSGLAMLPDTGYRAALLEAARAAENVFDGYDTDALSDFYAERVSSSPAAQRIMRWKYSLLQGRVDHLAETGAALDFYAGAATHDSHQFLFGTLLPLVLGESAICAALSTLYLHGCEDFLRTRGTLCVTRRGRSLWRVKALASLAASAALYALIAFATFTAYFAVFDYSGLWCSSVSSGFNYLSDLFYVRPFITWGDFTLAGYFAAALALSAALTMVFSLLASFFGTLMRSTYLAALLLGVFCFGGLGLTALLAELGCWTGYLAAYTQPIMVLLCCSGWFTELGLNAALPWNETISTAAWLLLSGGAAALALRRFYRKDVI